MPDLIHDPIVAPIFAAAALVAVLSFGFALLGAAGWLLQGGRAPSPRMRRMATELRRRGQFRRAHVVVRTDRKLAEAERRAQRAREVC